MTEEVDWELVAKNYQLENERLRSSLWREINKKGHFVVNVSWDGIRRFAEKNYIIIVLCVIILSYIISMCADIYRARRNT